MKISGVTAEGGEEISAFETSDTTAAPSSYGGGSSSALLRFELVKIKKQKAASTNELFKNSISANHLQEVVFEFYNASSVFYQISIKDVTVNHFSYLSPECSNCSRLFHQVWFDYKQIEVTDVATGNTVKYNRSTRAFY